MILSLTSSSQNELLFDEEKNYVIALLDIYTSGLPLGTYEMQWNMISRDETNSQCIGLLPIQNDKSHFAPRHLTYHKLNFKNFTGSEIKFRNLHSEKFVETKNFFARFHIIEANGLFRHIQ